MRIMAINTVPFSRQLCLNWAMKLSLTVEQFLKLSGCCFLVAADLQDDLDRVVLRHLCLGGINLLQHGQGELPSPADMAKLSIDKVTGLGTDLASTLGLVEKSGSLDSQPMAIVDLLVELGYLAQKKSVWNSSAQQVCVHGF